MQIPDDLTVLSLGSYLVVGKWQAPEVLTMPRLIQGMPTPKGMVYQILPLPGNPLELSIGPVFFSYRPDADLAKAYIQSTTGLVMAGGRIQ